MNFNDKVGLFAQFGMGISHLSTAKPPEDEVIINSLTMMLYDLLFDRKDIEKVQAKTLEIIRDAQNTPEA